MAARPRRARRRSPPTWPSTPRPRPPSRPCDAAIQAHGGNGVATEYGLLPYWGLARLLRIAPVNREMVLNYVAQHSLGLPRSY